MKYSPDLWRLTVKSRNKARNPYRLLFYHVFALLCTHTFIVRLFPLVYNCRKLLGGTIVKKFLSFILVLCFSLYVAGCSSGAKPESAVDNYFKAIKECNSENLKSSVQYTDDFKSDTDIFANETFKDLFKENGKVIKYKINGATVDNDEAKVKVNCTYGDASEVIGAAMKAYLQKALSATFSEEKPSDAEIQNILTEEVQTAIKSNPLKTVTKDIEVNCKKVDGEWKVVADENSVNIMSANIYDMVKDMDKSVDSKEK